LGGHSHARSIKEVLRLTIVNLALRCVLEPGVEIQGYELPVGSLAKLFKATKSQVLFALVRPPFSSFLWHFIYQLPFLYHHITRTDHRHNFSPDFYHLYLLSSTSFDFHLAQEGLIASLLAPLLSSPVFIGLFVTRSAEFLAT